MTVGLALCLAGIQLGNWQLRRAGEKAELGERIAQWAAAPAVPLTGQHAREWQRVSLSGRWLPEGAIFLDNRTYLGRSGYYALMPMRLDSGEVVLVNRGWIAAGADRRLPAVAGGVEAAEVEGVVRRVEDRPFTLARQAGAGRLWQFLDLPAYRQSFGLAVADFVVQQTSAAADGLVRDWPRADEGIDRHRGYAVQWYGLAAAAAAMTGLSLMRNRAKES